MRRIRIGLMVPLVALLVIGCGPRPQSGQQQPAAQSRPRTPPTPYPTRKVESTGFDAASLKQRYQITFSGPFWVQLVHRELKYTTVVVGIEPSRPEVDLEAEISSHEEEFSQSPIGRHNESGIIESEVLGPIAWSWATVEEEQFAVEQLVLFGTHPSEGCLLIARSEFPSDDQPIQTHLHELVAIAEIVGPGI